MHRWLAAAAGSVDGSLRRWRQARGFESTGVRQRLHRGRNLLKKVVGRVSKQPVAFVMTAPSPQAALDLFPGEWVGILPPPFDGCRAGAMPLYADPCLAWALDRLNVTGRRVLELGPLEGFHTFAIEQRGAASITAIEAYPRAYLRCLVIKETLGLTRARFLLGDCVAYLREHPEARYDVAVASGILYHLTEPVELLAMLASATDALFLWTHYFDAESISRRPTVEARFGRPEARTARGVRHTVHPYSYEAEVFQRVYFGGGRRTANWLERADILTALARFGLDDIEVGWEDPAHIHGPAFALVARRTTPR